MEVPLAELQEHLDDVIARAAAGEETVVTVNGLPVVRLVPFGAPTVERLGERRTVSPEDAVLKAVPRVRAESSVLEALDADRGVDPE